MNINSITLYNWQPYLGNDGSHNPPNLLDFTCSGKQTANSSIVWGENTNGKSSLWDAFYFAWYGHVPLAGIEGDRRLIGQPVLVKGKLPLLNNKAFQNRDYYFGVRMNFTHQNTEYTLVRYCDKSTTSITAIDDDDMHQKLRITTPSGKEVSNPQRFLNEALPEPISDFFIFDGEKLDSYSTLILDDSKIDLKQSIQKILRFTLFENGMSTCENLLKANQRKIRTEERQFRKRSKYSEAAEKAHDNFYVAQEKLDAAQAEYDALDQQKKDVETQLREVEQIRTVLDAIEVIDKDIKDLRKERKEKVGKKLEGMKGSWLKILEPILKSREETVSSDLDRQLDHHTDITLLKEKIETYRNKIAGKPCKSCERPQEPVSDDETNQFEGEIQECIDKIAELEGMSKSPDPKFLHSEFKEISKILRLPSGDLQESMHSEKRIYRIDAQIAQKKTEKNGLNNSINPEDASREATLSSQRDELLRKIGAANTDLDRAKDSYQTAKAAKSTFTDTPGAAKKSKSHIMADMKETLIEELSDLLESTMIPYRNKMRMAVQSSVSDIFLSITNMKSHYERLEIDDKFKLKIMTKSGAVDQGSFGQYALLAYSMIIALSRCSGINFPLIIDTPGRSLSGQNFSPLFEFLFSQNRQIIILATEKELTKDEGLNTLTQYISSAHEVKVLAEQESRVESIYRRA